MKLYKSMDDNKLENYLRHISEKANLNEILIKDLNNIVTNQSILIHNMAQTMNLQNTAINEIHQKINSIVAAVKDIEIRIHMQEDNMSETGSNVAQVLQELDNIKFSVDNIKLYNIPDNYFQR